MNLNIKRLKMFS